MKFFIASIISTIALSSSLGFAQKATSGTDIEGVYSGSIKVNGGAEIPLSMYLHETNVEVKGDTNEFFSVKKLLQGDFILDEESDPYTFTVADYQLDKGLFDLEYNRVGSIGTSGSIVALRFQGSLQKDGSISGTMTSGINSDMSGTFSVVRTSKTATALIPKAKYVGHWSGTITYLTQLTISSPKSNSGGNTPVQTTGATSTLDVIIDNVGSQSTANPADIETGTTPGRVGSFYVNGPSLFFGSTVVIDYLRQKIWLTYNAVNGTAGALTVQVTLNGTLSDDGNTISGYISSTGRGNTGTFIVKRVAQ